MIKLQTKAGYIAYKTTRQEIDRLGGVGICDDCCKAIDEGYLIPVLNNWLWENDNDDDPVLSLVYSILQSLESDYSFEIGTGCLKIAASILEL